MQRYSVLTMGKSGGKQKEVMIADDDEDQEAEDWCFECKDGGNLLLCDYKGCPKVYHHHCVGKKRASLRPDTEWICRRHYCSKCSKPPEFDCFCCPYAVCKTCIRIVEFVLIKNKRGLCGECLGVALLVEENAEFCSEGELDFEDRDTYECRYKEYLEIIMEQECFSFDDINAANARHSKIVSDSMKIVKGKHHEEFLLIDSDGDEFVEENPQSEMGTSLKKMETEVEFVDLVQSEDENDVEDDEDFVVKCKSIKSSSKRKRISNTDRNAPDDMVDCKVHASCFASVEDDENELEDDNDFGLKCKSFTAASKRQRALNRTRKYKKSECKFQKNSFASKKDAENEAKDDDDMKIECESIMPSSKCERVLNLNRNSPDKVGSEVQESRFASIVVDNIKLVYLRRGLMEKLIKGTKNFEEKLVGCFVKVKKDQRKSSHQLLQVTGIGRKSYNETNSEILLQVSSIPTYIDIAMLSDDDISEDECEVLRKQIEEGLIEKPTVVELEQKARILHEDMTKDWIERELARLQKRIDFLNEKGRRRELMEHLDRLELLKMETEQQRLLRRLPKVTAEVAKLDPTYVNPLV